MAHVVRIAVLATLSTLVVACGEKEDTAPPEDTGPFEDCQPVTLDEGSEATYTANPSADDHVKHHWYMPADVEYLRLRSTWTSEESWFMLMAGGIGWCPHSGTEISSVEGDSGELVLEIQASEVDETFTTFVADEQWFIHVGLSDYTGHSSGDSLDFVFDVQTCKAIE